MYNPFYPFTKAVFEALIYKGNRYFVMNKYIDVFIITHYNDLSKAEAHYNSHFNNYNNNITNSIIYDNENTRNHEKLVDLSNNAIKNKIYSTFFYPSYLNLLNNNYRKKIEQKIRYNNFRGSPEISIDFYIHFGCLYVKVLSRKQELNFNFEEIEQ